MIEKPDPSEYDPYYHTYVKLVESDDIIKYLETQNEHFVDLLKHLTSAEHDYAYQEGKWTLRELLRHIIDAERIFSYRALAISRNDKASLPGMDQNDYVEASDDSKNSFNAMIEEFDLLRRSNSLMFKNLPEGSYKTMGVASDVPVSVRALLYIIVGHLAHHINIIQERYLKNV